MTNIQYNGFTGFEIMSVGPDGEVEGSPVSILCIVSEYFGPHSILFRQFETVHESTVPLKSSFCSFCFEDSRSILNFFRL